MHGVANTGEEADAVQGSAVTDDSPAARPRATRVASQSIAPHSIGECNTLSIQD